MKKRTFLKIVLGGVTSFLITPYKALAQMMGRGGMEHGMMGGRCPMCGQDWDGTGKGFGVVPKELPTPKSQEWIKRLETVLALEKHSKIQYELDSEKYQTPMPYRMVIPQEDNHIRWVVGLFSAYGLTPNAKVPPAEKSNTLNQAYEIAIQLEADLVPHYEWLLSRVEDEVSGDVLNAALVQTRMHYMMFTHASRMGGMRGRMGGGMMHR